MKLFHQFPNPMEGTGMCTVCGAEDITLNDEEKCEHCAGSGSEKLDDDMDGPPEGTLDDENEM